MLAELEAEKATAVATIDQKVAAVRVLAGQNGNGAAPESRPKRGAKRATSAHSDAGWVAKARVMFERGERVAVIAKAVGKSDAAVYYHTKKWQRLRADRAPKGTELAGNVRCPSCASMTKYDPCEHCGKKVRG